MHLSGIKRLRIIATLWVPIVIVITMFCFTSRKAEAIVGGYNSSAVGGQVQFWINGQYQCTGTLIDADWVLTAKHCVTNHNANAFNSEIYLGDLRLDAGESHTVAAIYLNPTYDVALLGMTVPTMQTNLIRPYGIQVPQSESSVTVQGWGATSINGTIPASVLQTSIHDVTLSGNGLIQLASTRGSIQNGDSGAGVSFLGLACGVVSSSNAIRGRATATATDALADWIATTSHVGPGGICEIPQTKKKLRVMIMADQIVRGIAAGSKGVFSYLPNALASTTLQTSFVGSKSLGPVGSMDGGYLNYGINNAQNDAKCDVFNYAPDIVMLSVGSYDIATNNAVDAAPSRVNSLISTIEHVSPRSTVLVALLLPVANPAVQSQIDSFNAVVTNLVQQRRRAGEHVDIVDLRGLTPEDADGGSNSGPSPTENGYVKMSDAFALGIEGTVNNGWIAESLPLFSDLCKGGGGISPRGLPALRLTPLGDSITWGYQSSTGNGYRGPLRSALLSDGFSADFVGTQTGGSMIDPYNEGHPGYRIDQIAGIATQAVEGFEPNIVTLMAGTNDMNQSYELSSAPARLSALIDQVIAASPRATVLVSNLIPSSDATVESNIENFNLQVPGIVKSKESAGHHVQFVDMSAVQVSDLVDSLHPNDAGYQKIANAWQSAIQQVVSSGWISAPVPCSGIPAGCNNPAIESGSGASSGGSFSLPFSSHTPTPVGPPPGTTGQTSLGLIASGVGAPGADIRFADMNGDGRADYVVVDAKSGALTVWLNGGPNPAASGGWVWIPQGPFIATGAGVPGTNIRLADLNADGKADYIMIAPTGAMSAYLNGGSNSSAPNGWVWYPTGQIGGGITSNASDVQFADVNGDGRADYLVVDTTTGAVTCYLNSGGDTSSGPGWIATTSFATGVGAPAGSLVIFADVNNDGHADYLSVNRNNGSVQAWLNGGMSGSGQQIWIPMGQLSPGAGAPTPTQFIAYGDLNGDGRADLLAIDRTGGLRAWQDNGLDVTPTAGWLPVNNIASGVGAPAGSQYVLADMNGDGRADYIVINPVSAESQVWLNGGQAPTGWLWIKNNPNNEVSPAEGSVYTFADINGDGKADFLAVDPASGAIQAWQNLGQLALSGGSFNFESLGQIAAGVTVGSLKNPGSHVIFADIDGDGKADYIVVDLVSGLGYAWLNGGPTANGGWIWYPVKTPVTLPTGNHGYFYFADIDGDGKADFLIVQDNGSILGFLNEGQKGAGWSWSDQGQIASGFFVPDSTHSIRFADFNGDSRADYIVLDPTTGAIPAAYLYNGGDNPLQ